MPTGLAAARTRTSTGAPRPTTVCVPHARVLRRDGAVIEGHYAAGNVTASVMGDRYPGPGSTLGPAMTFSFVAANHAIDTFEKRQGRP